MNNLIKQLKIFSGQDFPVLKVTEYLSQYKFISEEIKSYCYYKDQKYDLHLVHKDKDFELLDLNIKPVLSSSMISVKGGKSDTKTALL